MAYVRKTHDEYALIGCYGGKREVLFYEETAREAKEQLKCYIVNEPYTEFRIKKVRVKND